MIHQTTANIKTYKITKIISIFLCITHLAYQNMQKKCDFSYLIELFLHEVGSLAYRTFFPMFLEYSVLSKYTHVI